MNRRCALMLTGAVAAAALFAFGFASCALAQTLTPQQQLAFDIFKELVEINTVTGTGDTGRAADAMAVRLHAAGFSGDDVQVFKPAPRKGNLVARLRGTGARKPILLMAHLDVVEALASDWSFDPFKLTEKDGYFYGRGSGDDKFMAATFGRHSRRVAPFTTSGFARMMDGRLCAIACGTAALHRPQFPAMRAS